MKISTFSDENFSPREFDSSKITDDVKTQLTNSTDKYANFLENKLGRKPSFEDMINDRLAKTSKENVDEAFNAYKYMWELSGRDVSKANSVYNQYLQKVTKKQENNLQEILQKNEKSEKSLALLYGVGFIWVLGATGALGVIRYIVNPHIPTWILVCILFIGFVIVWNLLIKKHK